MISRARGRGGSVGPVRYVRALLAALRSVPAAERAREGPHAQFGEDRALEGIFRDYPHGYCVEIGAYDGRTGSATYLFERKGWDCLLAEPIPELAEEIRRHRRCRVTNAAVSDRQGQATFHVAADVEQMSTLDLTRGQREWVQSLGGTLRAITVPTTTLDALLEEAGFPSIEFITIDVEGHEIDVLRGFSLEKHRPRVIIIEENAGKGPSEVARHMAAAGYVNFKRTGVNDWYAHTADAALIQPDAVAQFLREKAMRQSIDRVRAQVVRRLPAALRRIARV